MIALNTARLETTDTGFGAIADLEESLSNLGAGLVDIECSRLIWLDAHLASALRVLVSHSQGRNQNLRFVGLRSEITKILKKNGFFQGKLTDTYSTTMPSHVFSLEDGVAFAEYTRRYLSHPSMPVMSDSLQRKFFEGIDELFANSSLHSLSPTPICVCGQFFPTKQMLAITMSDGGHGIIGSYEKTFGSGIMACDAIDWAMQEGSTTRHGDIPGGLGLAILREFISQNSGRLIVASKRGYWCQQGRNIHKAELKKPFPGTSIVMEIDCSDRKLYDINNAATPDNIW